MTLFLGQKIKYERNRRGITVPELAKKIQSSATYIWQLENDVVLKPSVHSVAKIAKVFHLPIEYFVDDRIKTPSGFTATILQGVVKLSVEKQVKLAGFLSAIERE